MNDERSSPMYSRRLYWPRLIIIIGIVPMVYC